MNENLYQRLTGFSTKYRVPAVTGGLLRADGTVSFATTGVRTRDGVDKATPTDKWHIGSCAKSIAAVLYARLVERGDAHWQQPIGSLFPDLTSSINPGWNDRVMEELFLCRAGMKANPSLAEMVAGYKDQRSLVEQRSAMAVSALGSAPGPRNKFVYSNLGYMVIGAAIDRITGMPFESALQKYVLEPLEITSLGYGPPPQIRGHASRLQLGSMALFIGKSADPNSVYSDNPRMLSSAGTMHLTMADWAKFLNLFLLQANSKLLLPDTIEYLLTPPTRTGATMAKGWMEANRIKGASFLMQGSNTLWSATAMINTERTRIGFIVCNDGRTRVLANTVGLAADILFKSV